MQEFMWQDPEMILGCRTPFHPDITRPISSCGSTEQVAGSMKTTTWPVLGRPPKISTIWLVKSNYTTLWLQRVAQGKCRKNDGTCWNMLRAFCRVLPGLHTEQLFSSILQKQKPSCSILSGTAGGSSSSAFARTTSSRHLASLVVLLLYWGVSRSDSKRASRRSLYLKWKQWLIKHPTYIEISQHIHPLKRPCYQLIDYSISLGIFWNK